MADTIKPAHHGWDHAPGGEDPIAGQSVVWISVYDNFYYGQAINTSSAGDNLQYPFIDWSEDAGGIFSYVRSDSTIGATNNYNPTLLVDGVYTFSWDEHSDDVGSAEYAVEYHLPIANTPGGTADNRFKEYVLDENSHFSETYFRHMGSITLPVQVGAGKTIYPSITLFRKSTATNFDITFRNKLWIAYLGPLNNSSTFNSSHYGDPYPTTP